MLDTVQYIAVQLSITPESHFREDWHTTKGNRAFVGMHCMYCTNTGLKLACTDSMTRFFEWLWNLAGLVCNYPIDQTANNFIRGGWLMNVTLCRLHSKRRRARCQIVILSIRWPTILLNGWREYMRAEPQSLPPSAGSKEAAEVCHSHHNSASSGLSLDAFQAAAATPRGGRLGFSLLCVPIRPSAPHIGARLCQNAVSVLNLNLSFGWWKRFDMR